MTYAPCLGLSVILHRSDALTLHSVHISKSAVENDRVLKRLSTSSRSNYWNPGINMNMSLIKPSLLFSVYKKTSPTQKIIDMLQKVCANSDTYTLPFHSIS